MSWFTPANPQVPDLIALNSRWLSDKPAVVCGDVTLSWLQFSARCNQVANGLLSADIRPGERVAVLMDNSLANAEILFGIVCSGAVAVPLNTSVADTGIDRMLEDSDARAVFASAKHAPRIDGLEGAAALLRIVEGEGGEGWESYSAWRRAQPAAPPDVSIEPHHECNIIYSSGTTGLPKGIVHSHACRMAWTYDMAVALRYHSGARTLCSLSLYSNITWVAMLSTILAGGTLVIMPSFDAAGCLKLISDRRITHAAMVPVQWQRMMATPDWAGADLSSIQAVMVAGSPLRPVDKAELLERMPGGFIELYGLTEGLVTTLAPEEAGDRLDSVGRPCPGQDLKILGDDDRELPPGEAGEIVGYGRLVMSGYNRREEANQEATWTDDDGRRWLRTGDIGRLDHEGFLYLVDRKKDMIITGGQNIYPADIEQVVLEHPAVREVAVIGVSSEKWGETPLAVIVPGENAPDPDTLVGWVNERVGKQQRIAGAVLRDELPRNPNGKILKRELRDEYASLRF